ncbi:hypothetical protein [Erythrobacter sp. MTPC3]|uniref:hypothetical protein n=1 Tax=Erythrobacter sp. MTPC3 TaxID=3056564 RepID=UPI0036F20B41
MTVRLPSSWQVILADLALILFLTSLAGFIALREREADRPAEPFVAQAQALFRETGAIAAFDEWLELQGHDPRSQLTIFASYAPGDREEVWERAGLFASQAEQAGWQARIILQLSDRSTIHAAAAFDAVEQGAELPR